MLNHSSLKVRRLEVILKNRRLHLLAIAREPVSIHRAESAEITNRLPDNEKSSQQ